MQDRFYLENILVFFTNNKVVLKKAVSKQKLVPNKEDQKQNGSTGSNRHPGCGVQQRCIFLVFTRMVFQILCLRIKFCKTKSTIFEYQKLSLEFFSYPRELRLVVKHRQYFGP